MHPIYSVESVDLDKMVAFTQLHSPHPRHLPELHGPAMVESARPNSLHGDVLDIWTEVESGLATPIVTILSREFYRAGMCREYCTLSIKASQNLRSNNAL
jgi:hypothetical protein